MHQLFNNPVRLFRIIHTRQEVTHIVDNDDIRLISPNGFDEIIHAFLMGTRTDVEHKEMTVTVLWLTTESKHPFRKNTLRGRLTLLCVKPHRLQRSLINTFQLQHVLLYTTCQHHGGKESLATLLQSGDRRQLTTGETGFSEHPEQEFLLRYFCLRRNSTAI